jgi:hypothetical protein
VGPSLPSLGVEGLRGGGSGSGDADYDKLAG